MKQEQNCFAYMNGKCKVLRVKQCEGVGCSFFKTSTQLQMDRLKAFEHIQSLDVKIRNEIIDMYNLDNSNYLKEGMSYGN
ncbi:hypothetical protein BKP37_09625 [Anaerobacillus alkalilacustris]|uniref:Uncharacterized protein n=2 Tax=Anaerobacillus alkalilacustris TaxID=393763 RepID=A0A1S2LNL0_9BACI|nr:hypothetical protein BKP37_09625 [Anaerobacillus alkalilacustris]